MAALGGAILRVPLDFPYATDSPTGRSQVMKTSEVFERQLLPQLNAPAPNEALQEAQLFV